MIDEKGLIEIIEEALELKKGTVLVEIKIGILLWDSLGHLSILVKLDQVTNGKCSKVSRIIKSY